MSRLDDILNVISKTISSSLGDILSELQNQNLNISKATLKRDLQKLLDENLIIRNGQAKATRYNLSALLQSEWVKIRSNSLVTL